MPRIDTAKVKTIAGEMIAINNRYNEDFSVVEQAINRLKNDWQQPQKVSSAAFACFDEIKTKFFEPSISESREMAQYLCDAVGIGYEEAENANKKLLEGLFDVVGSASSIVELTQQDSNSTTISNNEETKNRLDSIEMLCNKFVDNNHDGVADGDYISRGCVLTTSVNLMRRKQAVNNEPITITKQDVIDLGYTTWGEIDGGYYNGKTAYKARNMQWGDNGSRGLCEQLGFDMESRTGTGTITESLLIEKLNSHPEGVLLYSKGSDDHAILVTEYRDGDFYVIDPNDGGAPVKFSECNACTSEYGAFKNMSFQQVLDNAGRISWLN